MSFERSARDHRDAKTRFYNTLYLRVSPPDTTRRKMWHAVGQHADAAREKQLLPTVPFFVWMILAGRGWGKTKTGAHAVLDLVERGEFQRFGIAAPTAGDLRSTVVEGPTGILACSDPSFRPRYEPSKKRIIWDNGAVALLYSADEPDRFRGANLDGFWADELAAWRRLEAVWDTMLLMIRKGKPRVIVTTTPKPLKLIRDLMRKKGTIVTRGHTRENIENLAPEFVENVVVPLEGTRLGRQELEGEMLEDVEGALWRFEWIRDSRVDDVPSHRVRPPAGEAGEWWESELSRIVVACDPSITATSSSDECGIVAMGEGPPPKLWKPPTDSMRVANARPLPHYYILADRSGIMAADQWARATADVFDEYAADRVVAEVNQGGDLVEVTLRGANYNLPVKKVHAAVGKIARAEPVAALYEQGRVHHVGGVEAFRKLEDEMCSFTGKLGERSPNRMDGLVWGVTELAGLSKKSSRGFSWGTARPRA